MEEGQDAPTANGSAPVRDKPDDPQSDFSKDENEVRGNWTGRLDFLLSCLGYAVGLGNVVRFPYKCYENGGGAFFIPYVIMLLFVGIPVLFLELSLGQYSSSGPLTCWRFSPIFSGVGYAMMIVSAFAGIYYNTIMAWAIYYFGLSFTLDLPWQYCNREWNTPYCSLLIPDVNCTGSPDLFMHPNGTCHNVTANNSLIGLWNTTLAKDAGIRRQSPSEEYYNNYVLGISDNLESIGQLQWQLSVCLVASWAIVFLCVCKGIKSSGKAVYFTALFPYVILLALLIRAVTMDGYYDGIVFYVTPKWERLADARVWNDAANQIFYSLATGFGGLIALSSYNRFHNNCFRDALIVAFGNSLTSVFAGFVVFAFLGFMAKEAGTTVEDVVTGGFGLAFVVYPSALAKMPPFPPAWAVVFFLMLVTLALDSQFANVEAVTTSLMDRWPKIFTRKRKTLVMLTVCVLFCLTGLIFCTNGGMFVLNLVDTYAGGWAVLVIGVFECVSLMWVYGWNRLANDIRIMIGSKPFIWWRFCWTLLSPAIILFILIFAWVDYKPLTYGSYVYPTYANVIGWVLTMCIVLPIPLGGIIVFCKAKGGTVLQKLRAASRPTTDWGPALKKHRTLVDYVPGFLIDPTEGAVPRPFTTNTQFQNKAFEPDRY